MTAERLFQDFARFTMIYFESRSPDGDGQSAERSAVGVASCDVETTADSGNGIGASYLEGRVEESAPANNTCTTAADRGPSRSGEYCAPQAGSEPADSQPDQNIVWDDGDPPASGDGSAD